MPAVGSPDTDTEKWPGARPRPMPTVECDNCGHVHTIPERPFTDGGGTRCPECGARAYTVRREGLTWHPER